MENNIFIKMKKDKSNPDVEPKSIQKQNERSGTKFVLSKSIYNPITGVIPEVISSHNDLTLDKDKSIDQSEILKMILEKRAERENQDTKYKPVKTKVINNTPQMQTNEQPNSDCQNNSLRKNYIETYDELKRQSKNTIQKTQNPDKNNYENILDGLKDLGIIQ